MLITEVNIIFKSGGGGNGRLSFYNNRKGPDGGNGGNGGSIYVTASTNIYGLADLSKFRKIEAENGQPGMSNRKNGKYAPDIEIKLPLGTAITDKKTKEVFEINSKKDRFLLCRGGAGGLGNWEYRSGKNTTPMYAQSGFKGRQRHLFINLKLIADYGLIGFPNAGKSSLLKELTSANPKIGDYPFTTLEPNLGESNGKIIADIPGLIQGASKGKGLGIKFLKHIEKVSLLFHCVPSDSTNLKRDYQAIRKELEAYNPKLLKIPEVILLTKSDKKTKKEISSSLKELKSLKKKVLPVSIHDWQSLQALQRLI